MKWWVFILLPFQLLAQETYDNCLEISPQTYQVSYDADKEYHWQISGGYILTSNDNILSVQWPDSIGTYIISVSTIRFGCVGDTSHLEVVIEECDYMQLFFPNSFTPNGDNHNEVYQIKGRTAEKIESIVIYNRWGERVFEADGNLPWNGIGCQVGLYTINVFVNNNRFIRSITLIR
tara:strand:- start:23 stop:553 length:531 start_codon:yes stop_codon:yes gene_type:complete